MGKHEKNSEKEAVAVEVEQPKEKVGDKEEAAAAKTEVDSTKKERAPRTPKNTKYRILDGVDATKFTGQRGHVIRALQGLAEKAGSDVYHSAEDVAAVTEGLVSRTPVLDSVTYHLKGMVKEGQVAAFTPEVEKKDEKAAA